MDFELEEKKTVQYQINLTRWINLISFVLEDKSALSESQVKNLEHSRNLYRDALNKTMNNDSVTLFNIKD